MAKRSHRQTEDEKERQRFLKSLQPPIHRLPPAIKQPPSLPGQRSLLDDEYGSVPPDSKILKKTMRESSKIPASKGCCFVN